jgi:hypothetical protein
MVSQIEKIEVIYRLKSVKGDDQMGQTPRYHWTIKQSFSYQNRNHLTLRLLIGKQMISSPHLHITQYVWIDIIVVFLSIANMLLTFKYIYEVAFLYNDRRIRDAKNNYKMAYKEQQEAY